MKALLLFLLPLFLLPCQQLRAQSGDNYLSLNYNPAIPLGTTADFVDETSWRGFDLKYAYFISDQLALGFRTGWNIFRQASDGIVSETIINPDNESIVTISGSQFRYINSFPILATADYHFGLEGSVRPYIGLGIGGFAIRQRLEMGLYLVEDNSFRFGLSPNAGLIIPMGGMTSVHLASQYNYVFSNSDLDELPYLSFSIGLGWSF